MHIRNDLAPRIIKNCGLTIGVLDHKPNPILLGHEAISWHGVFRSDNDIATMHLLHTCKILHVKKGAQLLPVFANCYIDIAQYDPMNKLWKWVKDLKLKPPDPILLTSLHISYDTEMLLKLLAFFALAMTFLSLWVKKSTWIWGSFLFIALGLATLAGVITPIALLPIALLGCMHFILKHNVTRWGRWLLVFLITIVSTGLLFHQFPGFSNWRLSFWVNFDKPFIGLFPLIYSIPLLSSRAAWKQMGRRAVPLILGSIACLGAIYWMMPFKPDTPHATKEIVPFLLVNLMFVCIPEEAFFRGFLQKEFNRWFGGGIWASMGAICATSIAFTFAHVYWVPSVPVLFAVFVASLLYGTVFAATQSIESSILCHFLINILLFVS